MQRIKVWREALSIVVAGVALSLLTRRSGATGAALASDMLFTTGMMFLILGLWRLIGNMGMFNSLKYGTKSLFRVLSNQKAPADKERDGYIAYVNSRPKHQDVLVTLLLSGGFLSLSVLSVLIAA